MYVEWRTSSTYNIKNFGGVAAGLGLVYRVQKDASGNWRVYDYYNNLLQTISGLPSTGAASAFIEHFRYSAASPVPGSPEVEFGASSPNTNNAMRLLGAKGYEPWDTSLLAGGTEKFYDQGESTFVSYSPNYWFGAWFNG